MACGVCICHQVDHVRQCAKWKSVLMCDKFYNRGAFLIKMGSKFVVFHPNFEPSILYDNLKEKWHPDARNGGKKGSSKFQGLRASAPPCNVRAGVRLTQFCVSQETGCFALDPRRWRRGPTIAAKTKSLLLRLAALEAHVNSKVGGGGMVPCFLGFYLCWLGMILCTQGVRAAVFCLGLAQHISVSF